MIATRRRKTPFKFGRLILPLAAIAALALALTWPPSHNVIFNGPLKPMWTSASTLGAEAGRPFSFVTQQQAIADRNRDLRQLNAKLETERQVQDQKDQRIAALQSQIAQLQAVPKSTPAPLPKPAASRSALGSFAPSAAAVPDEVKRTAAYWSSMDAEKAAAIAQRLPDEFVNRVFSQMSPDTVGDIMNNLSPKIAARLAAGAGSVANGK